jgi:hypothetical protein
VSTEQLIVTDHAVVRYLERVHNFDIDFYRDCIRHEIGARAIVTGRVIQDGFTWVFMNRHLVTVVKGECSFNVAKRA